MQKVILTIENNRNAYLLLRLIKEFDFVQSIEFENIEMDDEIEKEIFTNEWATEFYLDDLNMTVGEFQKQTLEDEKEKGMSKKEFFKSIKKWRETIEK
jgi:hypothetical protein